MTERQPGYSAAVTELCERALVTLIGGAGFWGRHLYLVGGLVPRYLAPSGDGPPHQGTRDIDLAISLAVEDGGADYETLVKNLRDNGFTPPEHVSFRWRREEAGVTIDVEFLGESPDERPGRVFKPRGGTGSDFQVLNVLGVHLLPQDHLVVPIAAERLGGGRSEVQVRVAGLLPFITLKIMAYQDRHHAKDVYDLVYVLERFEGGPRVAGAALAASPVIEDALCQAAIQALWDRFADPGNDAPTDYARAMDTSGDPDLLAQIRNEAVAIVHEVRAGYQSVRAGG